MPEEIINPSFLPLEPGNSGRVKYNVNANGGKFKASYIKGTWMSPNGDKVAYLEEESKTITGNVLITVIGNVLVKKGTEILPSVEITTKNCSNLVIIPKDIEKIAGLRPINFNPNKEI